MYLKILEISYDNKATVKRKIECLVKNIPEMNVVCIMFPVSSTIFVQRFFKFTFETQLAYGS